MSDFNVLRTRGFSCSRMTFDSVLERSKRGWGKSPLKKKCVRMQFEGLKNVLHDHLFIEELCIGRGQSLSKDTLQVLPLLMGVSSAVFSQSPYLPVLFL